MTTSPTPIPTPTTLVRVGERACIVATGAATTRRTFGTPVVAVCGRVFNPRPEPDALADDDPRCADCHAAADGVLTPAAQPAQADEAPAGAPE